MEREVIICIILKGGTEIELKSLTNQYLICTHLLEFKGDVLFKLSTKSVIEILGPPEKMETISSDLASKNTRVKNAFGLESFSFPKLIKDVFIFSFAAFKS